MSGVFLSYRRVDSASAAGRLYDHLSAQFGRDRIFMDIDTIKPGVDFVEVLEKAIGNADVLIAVIGRQWLTVTDANGKRRLDDPHDFTRLEVATALDRNIRVIPVLVDGASMPRTEELPQALAKLTRRNALMVSNERFGYDVGKLIETLDEILKPAAPPRPAQQPSASQMEKIAPEVRTPPPTSITQTRKRGPLLTGFLIVAAIGLLLFGYLLINSSYYAPFVVFPLAGLLGVYGAWSWKKWGIYILTFDYVTVVAGIAILEVGNLAPFYFSRGMIGDAVSSILFPSIGCGLFLSVGLGSLGYILRGKWKSFEGESITIFGRAF
jgi:hypothetical protein